MPNRSTSSAWIEPGSCARLLTSNSIVGNFFGSIAPTFWANKIDINAMFYEEYRVKMYGIVLACKRATPQNKPEICKGVVGGLMEGLKYVYLNPEKAIDLHIESLKEFQGGSVKS